MTRHHAVAAVAAALLLGVAWLWLERAGVQPPGQHDADATSVVEAADIDVVAGMPPDPQPASDRAAVHDRLPGLRDRWQRSSLRGAGIDGQIHVDAAGRLRFDPELRRRFEHYLALIGEFSLDELRLLLFEDVRASHGAPSAAIVAEAFDRYLGLRQALADAGLPNDPGERFARVQQLRRDWFGADADALFRDETDYDAYTLMRVALHEDARLDPDQRAALLAELEATRPVAEQAARDAATTAQLVQEHARQLDARRADAATRHAERSALWGEEAAERLADLDRQHDAWERRLQSYARARERILSDAGLDPRARDDALARLLDTSFAGTERLRIESLQAEGALPGGG